MSKRDYRNGKYKPSVELFRKQSLERTMNSISMEEKKREQPKTSDDTKNRMEIHGIICNMLSQKKGKIDILTFLLNKYPDTNLNKYFEQWIEYHIEKKDFINKDAGQIR